MRDPADTRRRILEAAERLYAEGGEEATSVRAVTQAAGVNVAAVQYHFSGQEGLLRAVLDRLVQPINERRLALLDAAVALHGDDVPVEVLLDAFLRPDLEAIARLRTTGHHLARTLGRAYTQPGPVIAGFVGEQFEPLSRRLVPLLRRALPDLPEDELLVRLQLVVAIVTTLFATTPEPGRTGPLGTDDVELQLARLLAFCVPAVSAPSSKRSTS